LAAFQGGPSRTGGCASVSKSIPKERATPKSGQLTAARGFHDAWTWETLDKNST
jgi:hypothetical protein